jgi:hypothetical protein
LDWYFGSCGFGAGACANATNVTATSIAEARITIFDFCRMRSPLRYRSNSMSEFELQARSISCRIKISKGCDSATAITADYDEILRKFSVSWAELLR